MRTHASRLHVVTDGHFNVPIVATEVSECHFGAWEVLEDIRLGSLEGDGEAEIPPEDDGEAHELGPDRHHGVDTIEAVGCEAVLSAENHKRETDKARLVLGGARRGGD